MSRQALWTIGFLTLTAAAIGAEIYAAADGNADTPTWSELVGAYVPQTIGVGAAAILAAWIVPHISAQYRSEGGAVSNIKLYPVAWLTTAAVVVGAVLEADRQYHLLPASWAHWVAYGALALGLTVAGIKAHGSVTPLARPKDDAGVPLVPVTMRGDSPTT